MIFVSFSILAYVGLFLPSCVGKGGRENLDRSKKTPTHSLRYACALFRSLKKSEASVAVRPVMAGPFLSGWYLQAVV
jgi:hypothetical protein